MQYLKITSDIKHAIQKIEDEKNKNKRTINDYTKLIQPIEKEYQRLALENELLKKKDEKNRREAVYHRLNKSQQKQIDFFEGRKKRKHKKQYYAESSSEDSESENYPPSMRRRSDVSFWSHLGWDVADDIETSSRRRF